MKHVINAALALSVFALPSEASVSGQAWCLRYQDSNDIETLEEPFKSKAKKFMVSIKNAGLVITVNAAKRPKEKQYLQHWAWRIANEGYSKTDPEPPSIQGLDIDWFWKSPHSSDSCKAADLVGVPNYVGAAYEMGENFALSRKPGLTCKAVEGKAVGFSYETPKEPISAVDAHGKTHFLLMMTSKADKNLQKFAATFGLFYVYEQFTHWPLEGGYWSDDGKWE